MALLKNMQTTTLGPGIHVTTHQDNIEMHGGDGNPYFGRVAYLSITHGDLLMCPFCAGLDLEINNTHTPSYWISCQHCGCECHGECPDSYDLSTPEEFLRVHTESLKSAVEFWNQRAASFQKHDFTTVTTVKAELRHTLVYVNGLKCPVLLGSIFQCLPVGDNVPDYQMMDAEGSVIETISEATKREALRSLVEWHNRRVDEAVAQAAEEAKHEVQS